MKTDKILCVDDDEKILKGIQRQLGDAYDLSVAVGPIAALQAVKNNGPFAVVVSDVRMPEMNGIQLIKEIGEITPTTISIVLTGYAELETTKDAANENQIFRFLAKPCSAEELASAIDAALRKHRLVDSNIAKTDHDHALALNETF